MGWVKSLKFWKLMVKMWQWETETLSLPLCLVVKGVPKDTERAAREVALSRKRLGYSGIKKEKATYPEYIENKRVCWWLWVIEGIVSEFQEDDKR